MHDTDHFTEKENSKDSDDYADDYEAPKDDSIELDEYLNDYLEDDISSYKLNINNYRGLIV